MNEILYPLAYILVGYGLSTLTILGTVYATQRVQTGKRVIPGISLRRNREDEQTNEGTYQTPYEGYQL